ncbi:hypothetical protein RF11_05614 [Thelohanellus kitauei]|uniref:EGF-like domain-containing protein n=1 Tax=Thelohanellus kitauei TaxID=669202 RepID=A0A0C2M0K1_THEKT|nr:hypothetical protein RF11_05614 [Thelohanellus kitauei]
MSEKTKNKLGRMKYDSIGFYNMTSIFESTSELMHKNFDSCIDDSFGLNRSSTVLNLCFRGFCHIINVRMFYEKNSTRCVCHEGYFGSHCNLTGKSLIDTGHDLIRLYSIKLTPEFPLMTFGYWVACSFLGIIFIEMIRRTMKCGSLRRKFILNYIYGPQISEDESQSIIDE